jgi:2'-5' RNA ligase
MGRSDREGRRFHNIFFGLCPDDQTAEEAIDLTCFLQRRYGLIGPAMTRDRLHITVRRVCGAYDPPKQDIERAMAAAASVRMPPFVVGLNRVLSWPNKRPAHPLVAIGDEGDIGVRMLHERLEVALRQAGMAKPRKLAIKPHMTLLWGPVEAPETLIPTMRFVASELRLIDSPYGESRHNVLGRWPLE